MCTYNAKEKKGKAILIDEFAVSLFRTDSASLITTTRKLALFVPLPRFMFLSFLYKFSYPCSCPKALERGDEYFHPRPRAAWDASVG